MDLLAQKGKLGLVPTVPQGMHSGSDVCNMTILGYDPKKYYTGRAPIEAAGNGLALADDEVAFRCNLVGLAEDERRTDSWMITAPGTSRMTRRSALISLLNQELANETIKFYPSVSYRNLCMVKNVDPAAVYIPPPHDILGQALAKHLPQSESERRAATGAGPYGQEPRIVQGPSGQ